MYIQPPAVLNLMLRTPKRVLELGVFGAGPAVQIFNTELGHV